MSEKLLQEAEAMSDKTVSIYGAELHLLRAVASASSDLILARSWEEFREANGGIEVFEKAHHESVRAWEQWITDGEG